MKKVLAFVMALAHIRAEHAQHNDFLRANQFADDSVFNPWLTIYGIRRESARRYRGPADGHLHGTGIGPEGRKLNTMVTAFILINVERPRLKSIADDLLAIDGIAEVYSVAGPFDMVAIVRVKEHEQLSDLVTEKIGALEGITDTETLIAFRAFSKKDLGMLWDIGVD
jgi:DNA-binding Lrp family transcriptional regulator